MTTALIALGGFALLALVAYFWGRSAEKEDTSEKAAKVSKKHAEIATERPKDKDELVDKLKKKGL